MIISNKYKTISLIAAMLLGGAMPAFADACVVAQQAYNAAVRSDTIWYSEQLKKRGADTKKNDGEWCPVMLSVIKERMSHLEQQNTLEAAMRAACGSRLRMRDNDVGSGRPTVDGSEATQRLRSVIR